MAIFPQPIISPSPDAVEFWESAREQRLILPFCNACQAHFFYPRSGCPSCGSRDIAWVQASGRGEIYSYCIHYSTSIPELRNAVPFVTALVTLEEGPRMMTCLVDVEPEPMAVHCGMAVEVTFVKSTNGFMVPMFRPT
ncbi:Zn-ribbon domain-containing OB-fold protein [Allopusillimonas ginsengisoli]|uniref:Zn-ribbon domain-containing OB-fold protein n=1 Tax=Allopusillimonas ginsengisoli TaxID=453575 RepID=UPI00101EFE4E|nr:OB-fold domain-containing protein [Allopusillimonas ginsengisoli]TEA78765.1 DNA-binding protein [Allopusillimonas ginsengisoli]